MDTKPRILARVVGEKSLGCVDRGIEPQLGVVIFLDGGHEVVVQVREGRLYLNSGGDRLVIRPESSNAVSFDVLRGG